MTQPHVRRVGAELAEELSRLHTMCFDPLPETPWSATAMRTILRMPGVSGYAIWGTESEPVGLLIGRESAGEAEILTICVSPAVRREGFARELFAVFIENIANEARLVLEVAVDNQIAIELYKSMKFQEVGRRPGYYGRGSGRVDALILARETIHKP